MAMASPWQPPPRSFPMAEATVLAYGQTGSGKTYTMARGVVGDEHTYQSW